MNPAGLDREVLLRELFDELIEVPPEDRSKVLSARGITDPELVAEVDALLDADAGADEAPLLTPGWLARLGEAATRRIGERIGDYRITSLLGSGGMGDVYLAERADGAFEQRVAIKLVRRDLASPAVAERFSQERRILARLNHPNIATMHGGGVTGDGRPYLIMEYVDGVPLDRYCEQHGLPARRRLELFAAVCAAVAHAHAQLTVHCDLKPDNVLITAEGTPKLLDFGIATALGRDQPSFGAAMTPAYAAPELMRGKPVTTAADVYALGVILYQLLGGALPSATRQASIGSRDLDAICRTALAPAPGDRYASASALAEDVQRYLERRPVAARGRSLGYAATLLVRRHTAAAIAAIAAVALVATMIVFYTGRLAAGRDRARAETERARAVSEVLVTMLEGVDPTEVRGEPLTARELLRRAEAPLGDALARYPEERARLLAVLGRVHTNLGHYADAERLFRSAIALERGELGGARPAAIAEHLSGLAGALREQTRLEDAEAAAREALALHRQASGPRSVEVASASLTLADVLIDAGHYEDALEIAELALAIHREAGEDGTELARSLAAVGAIHNLRGDYAAAGPLVREALEATRAAFGDGHPRTASQLLEVGYVLRKQGRLDEAEPYYRQALELRETLYQGDHPDVAHSLNHVARLLHQQGDPAAAEPIVRRALEMRRRLYGDSHAAVGASLGALSKVLIDLDRLDEAVPLARETYELVVRLYGDSHPYVAASLGAWANVVWLTGDGAQAERLFRQSLALSRDLLAPDHLQLASPMFGLGRTLCASGQREEGRRHLEEAARIRALSLAAGHPLRVQVDETLARCHDPASRLDPPAGPVP